MNQDLSSPIKHIILVALISTIPLQCESFFIQKNTYHNRKQSSKSNNVRYAVPARLEENVDGVVYVNEKCISCSACAMFAPETFGYSSKHEKFVVKQQPDTRTTTTDTELLSTEDYDNMNKELSNVRAAMSACPVAAIRAENSAQRSHNGMEKLNEVESRLAKSLVLNQKINGLSLPFPRHVPGLEESNNVWHLGYHNERSFGAVPYLVKSPKNGVTVMVDTPKFTPASVRAVISLCGEKGPNYLFLTHVDDVADHEKWRQQFPKLKRIFHENELANNWINDNELKNVEILLSGSIDNDSDKLMTWTLDGREIVLDLSESSGGTATTTSWPNNIDSDFIILHTPGQSYGSLSLLFHSSSNNIDRNILFTGDTYAYSIRLQSMTAFPYYGSDFKLQSQTLKKLLKLPMKWDFIAPGHGSYKNYHSIDDEMLLEEREEDVLKAIENVFSK